MTTWQGFSVMGSLRKLWNWLWGKHEAYEYSDASAVSSVAASATGSVGGAAIGALANAGAGARSKYESAPNASAGSTEDGTDSIIGAVVLAEILAGNHAATDSLTFDTPYTGQELNDDHFAGAGGEFSGAGSSGSFDSVDTSSDSSSGESSSSDSDSSSSSSGD